MKKALFCLILSCALLLTSCFSHRGGFAPQTAPGTDNFSLPAESSLPEQDGFLYSPDESGESCIISGCIDLEGIEELIIPDMLGGMPVRSITLTHSPNTSIKKLILPSTLTSVNSLDFQLFKSLQYNIYANCQYLGTADNPYEYLIGTDKDITDINVHPDTRIIAEFAFRAVNNIRSVTVGDGVQIISGSAFAGCNALTSVQTGRSVRVIGNSAFGYCESLKSVTFCEGLESIGDSAFGQCTALSSISLPDSLKSIGDTAFLSCTSLADITFGNSLESIGERAFHGCSALRKIRLYGAVRRIGEKAFGSCRLLRDVTLEEGIEEIYANSFDGINEMVAYAGNEENPHIYLLYVQTGGVKTELRINADTKKIAYGALNSSSISSLSADPQNEVFFSAGNCLIERATGKLVGGIGQSEIPADGSVTSIGEYAFYNLYFMRSVTIPESVTKIGKSAFYQCQNLTAVNFSEGLLFIDESAFSHCSILNNITLPDTLTEIGEEAFDSCGKLENITLGASLEKLGNNCFYNTPIIEINIPQSLKNIPDYCFYQCGKLKKTDLSAVEKIGDHAFAGCTELKEVILSDKLISIERSAFSQCKALRSLELPESLRKLGDYAFSYTALVSSALPSGLETIGNRCFSGTNIEDFHLPQIQTSLKDDEFDGCAQLGVVYLHKNITQIGSHIFDECESLSIVFFPGTLEEWYSIPKSEKWNAGTNGFKLICTDGNIEISSIPQSVDPLA